MQSGGTEVEASLASDLLRGAEAIALFIYGPDDDGSNKRRVYHAISKNELPTFRIGTTIHARKSSILRWIQENEQTGSGRRTG